MPAIDRDARHVYDGADQRHVIRPALVVHAGDLDMVPQ